MVLEDFYAGMDKAEESQPVQPVELAQCLVDLDHQLWGEGGRGLA